MGGGMSPQMDYFKLAVGLARAEGEATMKRVAAKASAIQRKDTCACSAYTFPHRPGSGECPGLPVRYTTDPRPSWMAEEAALFDNAEARAINSGAW